MAADPRPNPSTAKPASAFEFREPETGAGVEISLARMPLVEACERGFLQMARILLDAGANFSPEAFLAAAHAGPHESEPALDVVELLLLLLLLRGVPYAVFAQATLGRVDDLERSLAGIDLEARGPTNATPLFLAAWNAQPAVVKMLLEAGAEHACILEHLPTVKRLLREDSSVVDKPGPDGKTPLTSALISANRDLCEVLLAAGAHDPRGQGRALARRRAEKSEWLLSTETHHEHPMVGAHGASQIPGS